MSAPGGISEQNASDWISAVTETVRKIISLSGRDAAKKIRAISVSAQGATMTAVDEGFTPLCPAITWMDSRAGDEALELTTAAGGEREARLRTGWGISGGLDAPKILWIKRRRPELFSSAWSFVSTLEFVNHFLTGKNVGDPSTASIRALYNINEGRYDRRILEFVGIGEDRLPEIRPSGALIGTLTQRAADMLGA